MSCNINFEARGPKSFLAHNSVNSWPICMIFSSKNSENSWQWSYHNRESKNPRVTCAIHYWIMIFDWSFPPLNRPAHGQLPPSAGQVLINIFLYPVNYNCCIAFIKFKKFIQNSLFLIIFIENGNRNLKFNCSQNKKIVWGNWFFLSENVPLKKFLADCTILYDWIGNLDDNSFQQNLYF